MPPRILPNTKRRIRVGTWSSFPGKPCPGPGRCRLLGASLPCVLLRLLQFVGAYCCPPVRALVMEYCRGGSVRHWLRLRRGQRIPALHLLDMAADIAHAGA